MEQSVTKRIAKNFSWLLVGNVISGLINFFSIIYIARVLGAAAFGMLQFAQAFLLYLVVIVDSGLSTFGTREIAQKRNQVEKISMNIFSLRLVIAFVVFCLSFFILLMVPVSPTIRMLFIITFLFVFYRALNTDWVFQGLEKMEYVAVSKLLFSVTTFLFIVLFVRSPGDLVTVPMIRFIFGLLISIVFLLIIFKRFFSFNLRLISVRSWPNAFLLAIPLGISIVLLQIYDNLDTIMLGIMDTPAVVGIYNAAYRVFYLFAGVFSLWLATVLPVICKRMSEDIDWTKLFCEKFMRLTLLLTIPVTVLVCFSSSLFISLFFGNQYVDAIPALRYLIWALIPLAISNTYGSLVLIPAGLFNRFLASVGAGALANIVMNFILIPRFSYVGAAVATIVAQIIAGIIAYYFAQKVFRLHLIKYLIKPVAISLLSSIAFFLAYSFLAGQNTVMQLVVSNLAFSAVAGILILLLEYEFIAGFVREIIKK